MAAADLTAARLRELLEYNPDTGLFTRVIAVGRHGRRRAGSIAGGVQVDGGIAIAIDGHLHKAHRLAWFYMTGGWPSAVIDHISGDRKDNRWVNLRDVSPAINAQNRRSGQPGSLSGLLGVTWSKRRKKWMAQIGLNGVNVYLGGFLSAEDASAAYLAAKRGLHPTAPISKDAGPAPEKVTRKLAKSGYVGVHKNGPNWSATVTVNGRPKYIGQFQTPELAHAACVAERAKQA